MRCEKCNKEYNILWITDDKVLCDECDDNQDESTWTSIVEDFMLSAGKRVDIENLIFIIKEYDNDM